jgi:hypothetical protein
MLEILHRVGRGCFVLSLGFLEQVVGECFPLNILVDSKYYTQLNSQFDGVAH